MFIPISAGAFITPPVITFGTVDVTVGDITTVRGYLRGAYGGISADSLIVVDGEVQPVFRITTQASNGTNFVTINCDEERFARQVLFALQATYTTLEAGASGSFISVSDLARSGANIEGSRSSPDYSFTAGDEGSTFTMSWA